MDDRLGFTMTLTVRWDNLENPGKSSAASSRLMKNSDCRLLKKTQRLGARRFDERRRTCGVRCSETNKRNEAHESFQQPA